MSKLYSYVSQSNYKTTEIVIMMVALNEEDTVDSQFSTSETNVFPFIFSSHIYITSVDLPPFKDFHNSSVS
jgi:hypothetical protein